jgi:uncharacterized protein YqeY
MSLTNRINTGIKEAMKAKDDARKRTLRAIKSQLLLLQTDGTGAEITEEKEIKLLQKMVKERQDSYEVYTKQGREDLASVEAEEMAIIKEYLPEQMGAEELKAALQTIIATVGASSMKDMGKVMGMASKQFAGKADGKMISTTVKELLG